MKVRIQWAEPATDLLFQITARVYPGRPMRGPDLNGPGEPAEDPEVELLSVKDEQGNERPEMHDWLRSDFWPEIEEACLAEANEVAQDEMEREAEWAEESRREAARERASELRGVMAAILAPGRAS